MTFADPWILMLILAIPPLVFLTSRVTRDRPQTAYSDVGLLSGYRPTWRLRYRWVPTLVRALALALIVIALTRGKLAYTSADSVRPE